MKKFFAICLVAYTIAIGLLIAISLFVKASSFNKDYYPTSFILFLTFLFSTFLSLVLFQFINNPDSPLKQFFRYLSAILISIGLLFQILWAIELFKEKISSTEDIIVSIAYVFLGLIGIASLPRLLKHQKALN